MKWQQASTLGHGHCRTQPRSSEGIHMYGYFADDSSVCCTPSRRSFALVIRNSLNHAGACTAVDAPFNPIRQSRGCNRSGSTDLPCPLQGCHAMLSMTCLYINNTRPQKAYESWHTFILREGLQGIRQKLCMVNLLHHVRKKCQRMRSRVQEEKVRNKPRDLRARGSRKAITCTQAKLLNL